MRRDGTNVL
jgi:hypothetical protein